MAKFLVYLFLFTFATVLIGLMNFSAWEQPPVMFTVPLPERVTERYTKAFVVEWGDGRQSVAYTLLYDMVL